MKSYAQSYLGYSEIIGQRPTRRFMELRFAHLPQIATLRLMAGLAAIYCNDAENAHNTESALLRELGGDAPWIARACAALDKGDRVLFHDELYAGMAKMALRFAPRDDRAVPADFGVRIAECALMYSELLGMELLPRVPTGTVEDVLAAELRSIPRNRDHGFAIVGRYVGFVNWMRSDKPAQYGWKRSIDDDFEAAYGLPLDDYLAACVLFGMWYSGIRDFASMKQFDPIVDVRSVFSTLKDRAFVDVFVERFSIQSEELIAQWDADPTTSLSMAALGPLWNRPLIRLDDAHVVAPLPPLLYSAAGEGLYYNMFDRYDDATKEALSRCFGYFLETYVRGIFDAAYAGIPDCAVDGDVPYGKDGGLRTTDAVVFEGDDVIFVEVVGKRVNLKGAVLDLDEASIRLVLESGIRKKLKQLHTNVQAYRAGETFPERSRTAGQRIFAMIVTPVSYPHLYIVTEYIPKVLAEKHWLADVASVEIADVEEIEMMEDSVPRGFRLGRFLAEKVRTAHAIPIKNALIGSRDLGRGEPAIARGAAFVKKVGERLRV